MPPSVYPSRRPYVSPLVFLWYGLILSVVVVRAQVFDAALSSTCAFTTRSRRAVVCQQVSPLGVTFKYTIPCPRGLPVTQIQDCLGDRRNVCIQQNNIPCLSSFYCAETNRFSSDCSNIQSKATGSTCSSTDCNGNCLALYETVRPYNNLQGRSNACDSLGSDYYIECTTPGSNNNCVETSQWTKVLGDGTEVQITSKRESRTCDVRTLTGGQCTCVMDCPGNAIRYDCSQFSRDQCAIWDCNRQCVNNVNGVPKPSPPVIPNIPFTSLTPPAPVNPPPPAPVNPPPPAPVNPPPAPVNPPPAPVNPRPAPANLPNPTSWSPPLFALPNSWTATAPVAPPTPVVPAPAPTPPSLVFFAQSKDGIESGAAAAGISWLLTTIGVALSCLSLIC